MSNQNNIICWQMYNFERSGYITREQRTNYNLITGIRRRILDVSIGSKRELNT